MDCDVQVDQLIFAALGGAIIVSMLYYLLAWAKEKLNPKQVKLWDLIEPWDKVEVLRSKTIPLGIYIVDGIVRSRKKNEFKIKAKNRGNTVYIDPEVDVWRKV